MSLDTSAHFSYDADVPGSRRAAIEVEDLETRPGAYRAVAVSRQQFQLNDPTVSLRIVINIPRLRSSEVTLLVANPAMRRAMAAETAL